LLDITIFGLILGYDLFFFWPGPTYN
jgi:hypothetical protein